MITEPLFWILVLVGPCIFWLLPARIRLPFLALVSFAYLLHLAPYSAISLLAWTIAFYKLAPIATDKRFGRRISSILVLAILAYLAYFKYAPHLISAFSGEPVLEHFVIPLGISYFTFKLIHYALEVRRKKIPDHGFADFLCYIFLFPIFTAGPIERFDHFSANAEPRWNITSTIVGLTRIAHGLIKKFVFANLVIFPLFGSVNNGAALLDRIADLPTYKVWGFCFLSFFYFYLDFSAYSDIAIGASRLFGLRIMENFNWPIFATNIGQFWKRWHMSLAGWCQTYVYLPLIGWTRNPYAAAYATFIAIGLWHSGSLPWVIWGLWHATGVATFVYWSQLRRRMRWRGLDRSAFRWIGVPVTMTFVAVGSAITSTDYSRDPYDLVCVLAKLLTLNLPR